MNKEAAIKELNGQTLKLLDLYVKQEKLVQKMKPDQIELENIKLEIKELTGILQTLQFTIQTDGFVNMPELMQPTTLPSHTTLKDVNKALAGDRK